MQTLILLALCAAATFALPLRAVDSGAVTGALNALVALDTRTDSHVTLDYQNMASHSHFDHDNAPNPLFTSVDASVLQGNTYKLLTDLVSYYKYPDVDTPETLTAAWNTSINTFLDAVMATPVMQSAQTFLTKQSLTTDTASFRAQLYNMWFSLYARNTVVGSSGFESLFAGEISGFSVLRFNNWLRFYSQEQQGLLNYHGWFTRDKLVMIDTQFSWGTWQSVEQAILLNSSPEFEMAAYTVCALAGAGQCTFTIESYQLGLTASLLQKNGMNVIDQCSPSYSSGGGTGSGTTKKHSGGGGSNDPALQTLVDQMRAQDVDKPNATDYTLNWGNKVSGEKDTSTNPLFTQVNEAVFSRPVYSVLIDVIDKELFVPDVCTAEAAMTGFRKATFQNVLATWMATDVFKLATTYLQSKGVTEANDPTTLKNYLFDLWLGTYSRCKGPMGSSGFEHVFSGEWKSGTVDGQHNWARYYLLEKANKINYHGYFSYDAQLTGTFQYTWANEMKKEGGFLIGTSPAFDFSLLTVCALTHSGAHGCRFNLDNFPLTVTSYTQSCDAGRCLSTAYPTN